MSSFNRRAFVLCLSALPLAACGSKPPAPGPSGPARADAGGFGDRKPVAWQGRAPHRYDVHGIDVARFQDRVDWHAARGAGVQFAFVKATEGGDMLDPRFGDHWHGARRAGVHRGAYHFFYFCTSAVDQARWYIANVPRESGALPPVLDMEWNPFSPTCRKRPDGDIVRREAQVFLDALERHYGQRPIIYTTPEFYRDNAMQQMRGEEFWLRSTARHPQDAYPGQNWAFWQYSGTGIAPGINGDVDLNTFSGGTGDWNRWLAARRQ